MIYNTHLVSSRTRRSTDIKDPFSLGIIVQDDKENINTVTLNVCTRYVAISETLQLLFSNVVQLLRIAKGCLYSNGITNGYT